MPQSDPEWLNAEGAGSVQVQPVTEAEKLVQLLNSGGLYVRTALLLVPANWLGREGELAVKLGVSHVNYQHWKLPQVQAGQAFLMYSAQRLLDELDAICVEKHARNTLLVSLLDLPLSALPPAERRKFWQFLHGAFSKRARGLLLGLPANATTVLPDEAGMEVWRESRRLAHWNPQAPQ